MADGQLFKPEKDYTKEADKQIPEAEELAKVLMALLLDRKFLADTPRNRAMSRQQ